MLELYEDALEFALKALEINPDHQKSLFRKGKALMFLFEFQEAEKIFKDLQNKEQLEILRKLYLQKCGNYSDVFANYEQYHNTPNIVNYCQSIEIKMTEKSGRGLYATQNIPMGTLIIVERYLAAVESRDEEFRSEPNV